MTGLGLRGEGCFGQTEMTRTLLWEKETDFRFQKKAMERGRNNEILTGRR